MPKFSLKSFSTALPDASVGDYARLSAVDTFKTALANGASGAELAAVIANTYSGVEFNRTYASGQEALSQYRVVAGDPGADALKIQLGSTGKWLTQYRPDRVVDLAKYPGMTPGTDVTDVVRSAIEENTTGAIFIWPVGTFDVRYKNLLLRTGHVHQAAIPGQTTINAVTGGTTQAAAYTDSVFSIPTDNGNVAVRGFVFTGVSDVYFAVHARNGANKIVVEDCHFNEIGCFTSFYYRHAAFGHSSSTDANRVKNVLIQRCTGTNVSAETVSASWGFIDLRYIDGAVVRDCRATGFDSSVVMWGGDANPSTGQGVRTNERKCKNILVDHCHFTGATLGGIWGAMCYNCHITNCYVEDIHDIGYDWEGSDYCTVTNSVVKDVENENFGNFFLNDNVQFHGITSIISDAMINCHYRSFNATGNPTGNNRVRVERCYFLTLNGGVALSYCLGGPVNELVFENNFSFNSRFDLSYPDSNGNGHVRFVGNELYFDASAPPEMVGTVTSATADTLVDSTKAWQLNTFRGCRVSITSGTGAGQTREIRSSNDGTGTSAEVNTGTSLSVRANSWAVTPDNTSTYRIEFAAVVLGGQYFVGTVNPYAVVCQNNTIIGLAGNRHYARGIVLFSRNDISISGIVEDNRIFRFATAAHTQSHVINGGRTVRMFVFRNMIGGIHAYTTTGETTSGSAVIPVADSTTLVINQEVSGAGIPTGSYITAIAPNSITLNNNATATATGVTLTFGTVPWGSDGTNTYVMVFDGNYEFNGSSTDAAIGLVRTPRARTAIDYGSIAVQGTQTLTLRILGARPHHRIVVSSPTLEAAGLTLSATVTASHTVTVVVRNLTNASIDPADAAIAVWIDGTNE